MPGFDTGGCPKVAFGRTFQLFSVVVCSFVVRTDSVPGQPRADHGSVARRAIISGDGARG